MIKITPSHYDVWLQQHDYGRAHSFTRGMTKGSLNPRATAMVRTGSRQENMAAKRMILPIRGLTGRLARW